MPLFEQPLFRVFDVGKYAKIYPTIPSHYFGEPFLVKMFWSVGGCDLYIIPLEDLSLASYEVSIYKRYFSVSFQEVEKKFVFICALAAFRNQLILLPDILCRARASKPCGDVVGHFFNLKLQAHSHSFLTRRITSIKTNYIPRGRDAELGKSGVRGQRRRPALLFDGPPTRASVMALGGRVPRSPYAKFWRFLTHI
jgi:hypothetical protein